MAGRLWTDEQLQFLRESYPRLEIAELTAMVNAQFDLDRTRSQVRYAMRNHKIKCGRKGYQPGHQTWNKGLKGSVRRSQQTQFQPGNRPWTWKPIGTERITKCGYLQVKITDTGYTTRDWIGMHTALWKAKHGELPQGHIVIFIDGNNWNFSLDNLTHISRRELLWLNRQGYNDLPAELRPSAIALARLVAKKHELLKHAA